MSTKTKQQQRKRSCDNCAAMSLMLCGDGLLHRHCDTMNLYIADWNTDAVCNNHRWPEKRKGVMA